MENNTTAPMPEYSETIYEVINSTWETIGYSSQWLISTLSWVIILKSLPTDISSTFRNIRKWSKRYEIIKHIFIKIDINLAKSCQASPIQSVITYMEDSNKQYPTVQDKVIDVVEKEEVIPKFITILDDWQIKLELSTGDNETYCVLKDWQSFKCDESGFANFLAKKTKALPMMQKIKKTEDEGISIGLGDTVLLWWPTGTGKTFRFHEKVKELMDSGIIDYAEKITVTDGFEDTDFLAYISPKEEGGINIIERSIVKMLREASKGKKVAICIDELNRGSRSLMNLILTFIDSVDGNNYVLNNFVADERIVIPRENLLVYATINLGWRYSGVNSMDEALKDRFTFNSYVGYNQENEKELLNMYFGTLSDTVEWVIKEIRELYTSSEIGSSISTRGLRSWGEVYSRMPVQTPKTLLKSFMDTLMFKLTSPDDYWVYSSLEEASILNVLRPII